MSFVKSVFYILCFFVFLFNLAAENMICPKSLYHSHNQPEITPGEYPVVLHTKRLYRCMPVEDMFH